MFLKKRISLWITSIRFYFSSIISRFNGFKTKILNKEITFNIALILCHKDIFFFNLLVPLIPGGWNSPSVLSYYLWNMFLFGVQVTITSILDIKHCNIDLWIHGVLLVFKCYILGHPIERAVTLQNLPIPRLDIHFLSLFVWDIRMPSNDPTVPSTNLTMASLDLFGWPLP